MKHKIFHYVAMAPVAAFLITGSPGFSYAVTIEISDVDAAPKTICEWSESKDGKERTCLCAPTDGPWKGEWRQAHPDKCGEKVRGKQPSRL